MARPETTPQNEAHVGQENRGREIQGGGEWPDPDAAPTGPAPGTTAAADDIAAQRDDVPVIDDARAGVSAEDAASRTLPDEDRD